MDRKTLLSTSKVGGMALGAVSMLSYTTPATAADTSKPNMIYLMMDDIGYYELSMMKHKDIITPNIDKIASEGIVFSRCYAGSSLCAPTRAVLMLGKHTGHTSVRSNKGTPIREDEVTVAQVLKKDGYATGGFGKWGLGGRGSTGIPEKHGFDMFFGYYNQGMAHTYYPKHLDLNSKEYPLEGNEGHTDHGAQFSHYIIWDKAMEFLKENKDKPFFLYLPITPPHGLWGMPEDDPSYQLYKDKPWPENAKIYAAMINMVDRQIGEMIQMLKDYNIDDNTILFISGDNGGSPNYFRDSDHPNGFFAPNVDPASGQMFKGGKNNFYEGGLRVPFIVRWPGHIQPGRKSDMLCFFGDVFPTLCDIAKIQPPADLDGISLLPELIGEAAAGHPQKQHKYIYWEMGKQRAVITDRWKAVIPQRPQPDKDGEIWELYDLKNDVTESHNVAKEHPEIFKELKQYAEEAHIPQVKGSFPNGKELDERDRNARYHGGKEKSSESGNSGRKKKKKKK